MNLKEYREELPTNTFRRVPKAEFFQYFTQEMKEVQGKVKKEAETKSISPNDYTIVMLGHYTPDEFLKRFRELLIKLIYVKYKIVLLYPFEESAFVYCRKEREIEGVKFNFIAPVVSFFKPETKRGELTFL